MKRTPRRLLLLSLGALGAAIVLALGGGLLLALGPQGKQRLSDGSVVTLESVSYGRRHVWTRGGPSWRQLAVLIPSLEVFAEGGVTTGQDTLAFTLTRRRGSGAARPPWRMATLDEHGCQFTLLAHWEPVERTGRRGDLITRALASSHPRRGETVSLGIFPRGRASQPLARFTTANPTPGEYPTWPPEPYPITKRSGDLTVTLHGLKGRETRHGTPLPYARYSVRRGGRAAPEWKPVASHVSDPTGNSVGMTELEEVAGDAPLFGLCTHEPAWKLRLDFACAAPLRAPPDLTWTVGDVPVPAGRGVSRSTAALSRGGATLEVLGVARGGPVSWQPGQTSMYGRPHVRVRVRPGGKGLQLTLARATDERGRSVIPPGPLRPGAISQGRRSQSCDASRAEADLDFELAIPAGAKRLRFTFLAHRTHSVEFLASPRSLRQP